MQIKLQRCVLYNFDEALKSLVSNDDQPNMGFHNDIVHAISYLYLQQEFRLHKLFY
jgi:hypothetical protein